MAETLNIEDNIYLNARDFMQMLKDQGMVIGPKTVFDRNAVDGIPLETYRERVLRNKLISFSQISKARLWGDIGQKAVYTIAKEHLPESDLVKISNRLIKIPREAVKSIAASRGFNI